MPMPGQRAAGQKGVLLMMRQEFLEEIDKHLSRFGYSDRSSLIRDAVYEKLSAMGLQLPTEIKTAPSRAGKGGPKREKRAGQKRGPQT